jgi:uncharacterized protein
MIRSALAVLLCFGVFTDASHATARDDPNEALQIVTGPDRGTYIQIGRDLAGLIAEPAGISLTAVPTQGSAENVRRLRSDHSVRLALMQADVYQAYLDEAKTGNQEAAFLIKPLRVVMPLYNEEIYFVVRADSPLNFVHEIKDKRINIGPLGSGTSLTATTVYRQMFGSPVSEKSASFLSNEDALLKLTAERPSIDVAVIVAGQPAKLFVDMKPEARRYIKLLKLDPRAEETRATGSTYVPSVIRATSHPAWLGEDVPALTIRSMLVTYDFQTPATRRMLARFAESLCARFDRLQAQGHPKWQSVRLGLPPLGKGWSYYAPTERALAQCLGERAQPRPAPPMAYADKCSQSRQVLGLCDRRNHGTR